MRKMLGIKLFAAACALAGMVGVAAPAQAAPANTQGSACNLSANWRVKISATWYGNDLAYVVMKSPGPLAYGSSSAASEATAYNSGTTGPIYFGYFANVTPAGASDYTYRANITGSTAYQFVYVDPTTTRGISCSVTLAR